MRRSEYADLLARIDADGIDSRLHWADGPRAGQWTPWTGEVDEVPKHRRQRLGRSCFDTEQGVVYAETLTSQPRLVILGAGHVGVPVAAIGAMLGFAVTVIDYRPEFATKERFPDATQIVCAPWEEALSELVPYANTFFVIATPGHWGDQECVRIVLNLPHQYVGMIGSRAKNATVRSRLIEEGFSAELFDTVHAPIGLPIGGREPAEIAVSICAEILQVRHARPSFTFDLDIAESVAKLVANPDRPAALATIIGHQGSTPRGTGSRMLVYPSGSIVGSVGGGGVEAMVIERAVALLSAGTAVDLKDYDLSPSSGELDMICGGTIRVLTETL